MKYKTITLLLNIYNYNKLKDIEIILLYNKTNKDLIINELNNTFNIIDDLVFSSIGIWFLTIFEDNYHVYK